MRLASLLGLILATTAIQSSMAAPQRRERFTGPGDDGLYPYQRDAVRALAAGQQASELLSRLPAKRHQPKRKAQRPNRAQRRGK